MSRRRVLLIGVGTFRPMPDAIPALNSPTYVDLPFAHDRVKRLAEVLRGYEAGGFEVSTLFDPDEGEFDREWVSTAQHPTQPIKTLFLVDPCGAGRVANPEGIDELQDDQIKAWCITASRSDEDAFEGYFTESLIEVVKECAVNGLGTDSSLEFVRFDLLAARVKDLLVRRHGHVQTVRWTKAEDFPRLVLPFFRNPRYRYDPVREGIARLSGPLQPFLQDKVADAEHFRLRAGDHFTGRRSLLSALVPWLDSGGGGNLRVVTGRPGTGKSALLGALVCAAHPALIEIQPALRRALNPCPQPNNLLAAVHARQQGLDQIVESLTVQLGIVRSPGQTWLAADLIQAVIGLPRQPVVVLDALDECAQFPLVQSLLLVPLAHARRPDSTAACRMLVGVRPRPEDFAALFEPAGSQGGLHDLDAVDPAELHDDLRDYALARLQGRIFRDLIAAEMARVLAAADSQWGEFLVAGRFLSYLSHHYPESAQAAKALGDAIPTALPDILERELADHADPVALRAALTALVYAKGKGMPESIAREVARAFGGNGDDLLGSEEARLYLRLGIDDDHTSLYRLYHEGLADYLRGLQPDGYATVFAAIAETRNAAGSITTWESAPGYLKRYAIEHAADAAEIDTLLTDAEFLVYADPDTLLRHLDAAVSPQALVAQAVYRATYHLYRDNPSWRRMVMRLNALRYGATDLARRLGSES